MGRLDKSYKAMYRDMNVEYTALEAGLDRFIKFDKESFIGRDALVRQRDGGLERRLVTLRVETVGADAYMNEGIYCDGDLVGRVTSGSHSHHLGYGISLGYVAAEFAEPGTELEIPILGQGRMATVIEDSPYDPDNQRSRL